MTWAATQVNTAKVWQRCKHKFSDATSVCRNCVGSIFSNKDTAKRKLRVKLVRIGDACS